MFDVYLNDKRDLLVVTQGSSLPRRGTLGIWRKRKQNVSAVSREIRSAVQEQGHYLRRQNNLKETFQRRE